MITPMEIQNHDFKLQLKGYQKEAVRHFLYSLAEEFENLIEQNHKMAQELAVLRERIKDMESRDKILKDTLVTAQQVKTDIQENAEKEAELLIRETMLKADKIYEEAKGQLDTVRQQMVELKRIRDDMLAESEMMVSRFSHFVEAERQLAVESDKLHNFNLRSARNKEESKPRPKPIKGVQTGS